VPKLERALLLLSCLLVKSVAPASAASLQVSPVSFELPAAVKATQLTLHNLGDASIDAQIRVFRWTQKDGEEQLTPSTDVVASPPAATLTPHQDYVVRLVRVAATPVDGEETYRLLVDEVPQAPTGTGGIVNFVVRYSIPVFFAQTGVAPDLAWTTSWGDNRLTLTVRNQGASHVRIAGLKIESPSGASISFGQGLVGYVLAHSTMHWSAPAMLKGMARDSVMKITAQGNNGPISAAAALQVAN
jgi:fimbrial chaperone protein